MDEPTKIVIECIEKGKQQDSLDIGSASKGGAIKIYGNADNPEEFRKKIDNMIELRKYANEKVI